MVSECIYYNHTGVKSQNGKSDYSKLGTTYGRLIPNGSGKARKQESGRRARMEGNGDNERNNEVGTEVKPVKEWGVLPVLPSPL